MWKPWEDFIRYCTKESNGNYRTLSIITHTMDQELGSLGVCIVHVKTNGNGDPILEFPFPHRYSSGLV